MTSKEFVLDTMRRIGKAEAADLRTKAIAGTITATELISNEQLIPLWTQKDYTNVPVGSPYQLDGQVYTLTIQHDATGDASYKPGVAFSLWNIKHTTDPAKAKPFVQCSGTWGIYNINECMVWTDGLTYRSKINNNSWTPTAYPAGWEIFTA